MQEAIIIILWAVCLVLGYKRSGIALWISPFACVSVMVLGGIEEEPMVFMLGPALLLTTWISVLIAPCDPDADLWPRRVARWLLGGTALLTVAVTVSVLFGPLGAPAIILAFLLTGSLIVCGLTTHRARAGIVFSTLNASMRQNLPLPMALDAAAAGRQDGAAEVMRQISRWLVRGHSLSEAIRLGYPKCPAHAYGMVVASERMGQLPSALAIIERDMHAMDIRRSRVSPMYPAYPLILMALIFIQVSGLMTFVMPQFTAVLRDLAGAPLPLATQWLVLIHRNVGQWLAPLFIAGVLAAGVLAVVRWWRPRRPDRPTQVSRGVDFLTWHLPILHWFQQNQSMVQTIGGLRMSLAAGCPTDQAIANVLPLDVNACFRRRLAGWLQAVQQGQDVSAAAVHTRVGPALAWAFDTKVNQGNTPAVLEMLESFYRSNYSYRVNLARFVLWPGMTLAIGCVVAFVAYAVFSPIVATLYACMSYMP